MKITLHYEYVSACPSAWHSNHWMHTLLGLNLDSSFKFCVCSANPGLQASLIFRLILITDPECISRKKMHIPALVLIIFLCSTPGKENH